MTRKSLLIALNNAPLVLFALVAVVFGSLSGKFLEPQNFINILIQASGTGIVAIGMTFVLLTAGVDLSVGSVMFVAVLGGTSLFGGRGRVFSGTVLGAVLIQTVENGLVILNADPYTYPLVTSAIIFAAVLVDSLRTHLLARLNCRRIYVEGHAP